MASINFDERFQLAINILPTQLTKKLATTVIDIVNDTNIFPSILEFDIIENSLITHLEKYKTC